MKKQIITLLSAATLIFSSCSDWFDVTSGSEIREEDHYKTETGFQQSLIGCYIAMTDNALYGKNLSWYATEILAHQFQPVANSTTTGLDYQIQMYAYSATEAVECTDAIWAQAYNVIANANEALKYIDEKKPILDPINYHVIKGELLAIRAYMHLDLLRLYGYGNWTNRAAELNSKITIPYVTGLSKDVTPQVTGEQTLKLIFADLDSAAELLKEYDPITNKHDESYYATVNIDGFYRNRTLHLNYYAVKALQARAYLWEGSNDSKAKALTAAEEVISATDNGGVNSPVFNTYLHLLDATEVNNSNTSLAKEHLFGLQVSKLADKITNHIKPDHIDSDVSAMYLSPDDALSLYENSPSDIRYLKLLRQSTNSSLQGFVPLKVYQGTLDSYNKDKVSLIRLPEIYYIAAECYTTSSTPNLAKAVELLNTIRQKRGIFEELKDLSSDEVRIEIAKEYRKEFLSEGVMFYYYKRTGATKIPHNAADQEMGDTQYVLPYPIFEIQSGRVQ